MELLDKIKLFCTENWQRKIVALLTAIIVWFLVNESITITKTISNVPVRITNLPQNKTIEGILPNGYLNQRLTLTLTGNKSVLHQLDTNNLQVVINAENKGDQWIAKVDKESLVSTSQDIDLSRNITEISQNEFVIHLSSLITEKIPIIINEPIGDAPTGYQFLDIWPQNLYQIVSGPEEQVKNLSQKGFELTFDLDKISSEELDNLYLQESKSDEVSFLIPDQWKKVSISFPNEEDVEINDPLAENLRIDFLKKVFLPLDVELPISLYFPLQNSSTLNPKTNSLEFSSIIENIKGITVLKLPLFVKGVSKQFLDVVRNNIQIVIIVSQKSDDEHLNWTIQFVNPQSLENAYVDLTLGENKEILGTQKKQKEDHLRSLFRIYMRQLELYTMQDKKLHLIPQIHDNSIVIKDASA